MSMEQQREPDEKDEKDRKRTYLVDIATVPDDFKPFILQHYCLSLLGKRQFIGRHPNYHVHLLRVNCSNLTLKLDTTLFPFFFFFLRCVLFVIIYNYIPTSLLGKAFLACCITLACPWEYIIASIFLSQAHRMEQIKDAVHIHPHSPWGLEYQGV